jgi:hypothetical protein
MNFELPPTGTEQPPAFTTAIACQDWLGTVPMANAVQAQSMLLRQLSLMHRFTLPADERFAILETLRAPLCDVQDDAAKKFAGKPLPLAPHEHAALDTSLKLWGELALGYLRCFDESCGSISASRGELEKLREHCNGDPKHAARAALMAQRTLAVFADWQLDLSRGGQLPDASYWRMLHKILHAAEILGISTRKVNDPVHHGSTPTGVLAAYAECCLLSATNVYELQARHLTWAARWARRWGAKLALLTAPPDDIRNRAVPLWVDLESDRPPSYLPRQADGGRWLETTELRKSLVARITLLEQGRAPGDLQLGDDVTQPAATVLLQRVLLRWCKGGATRRQDRQPADEQCAFIAGLENVHFELSGRVPFRAPSRSDSTLRREREEFETFGNHSQRHTDGGGAKSTAHIETWRVIDESASGLRLRRPLKEGARIGPGQVVATRIGDGPYLVLGNVRWVLREGENSLVAGLQLFPGEAKAASIRALDAAGSHSVWHQAFVLPAIPALKESSSLVLPAGTFRLDRVVEVMVDQKIESRKLFRVLDRGIEFERCNFYD